MTRYLFVTGKLAAHSLRATLAALPAGPEHKVVVLPISVAALMDTRFIAKHLKDVGDCDQVIIPGLCNGDTKIIAERLGVEVIRGPKSLKEIPAFLGKPSLPVTPEPRRMKILAEIVDACAMGLDAILERAAYYKASGADVIDIGCPANGRFDGIDRVVKALKGEGFVVSVDSFNPEDLLAAERAGADYLLSFNSDNIEAARGVRGKVVVIPDFDKGARSLDRNISKLESWGVRYIIDPVLTPIGCGFAESLRRYVTVRHKYPRAEMLLGAGNITEMTDADSTGVSAVMAGFAAELGIQYVLTTEVVSWARGAVREMDIARSLMSHACENRIPPKNLDDALITVKDPPQEHFTERELRAMKRRIRDHNYRIFVDRSFIYVFNNKCFIKDTDIQRIFRRLEIRDSSHAFYLGRELQKALLAVRLGKRYVQESDLRWGYLGS